MDYQKVLGFPPEIFKQLYFSGWKLLQRNKGLKETDTGHALKSGRQSLFDLHSPNNSLESACGQRNNCARGSLAKLEESPVVWELTQSCDT